MLTGPVPSSILLHTLSLRQAAPARPYPGRIELSVVADAETKGVNRRCIANATGNTRDRALTKARETAGRPQRRQS
jgi:hypothetical protein